LRQLLATSERELIVIISIPYDGKDVEQLKRSKTGFEKFDWRSILSALN
jgi:hypothetical protein